MIHTKRRHCINTKAVKKFENYGMWWLFFGASEWDGGKNKVDHVELAVTVREWMDELNPRLRAVRKLGFRKGSNQVL